MVESYDYDISPEKGSRVYLQMVITEDSLKASGSGGVQSLILGSFGTGKSTLLLWIAQLARYMERGGRDSYISNIIHHGNLNGFKTKPTTVLWRCRDMDNWILAIPENWKERVPNVPSKKVAVFVHKDDYEAVSFFMFDKKGKPAPVPNMPAIQPYASADELISIIKEGAINIVLEPQTYRLSKRLADLVSQAKSRYVGALDTPDSDKDDIDETPVKRGRGRPVKPKVVEDYSEYSVKSGFFWVDVVAAAMSGGNRPIMFIWDEADDFLSAASADVGWWAIQVLTEMQRDFRKANISVVLTSHGWNLLHDSVYKRCTHRIYFPGVRSGKNTMVRQTAIISGLLKGQFIAEKKDEFFGLGKFSRIPNPMQAKIDGLKNTFTALSPEQKAEIRAAYERMWRERASNLPAVIEI